MCHWRNSIFRAEGGGWQNLLYLASITNRCFCALSSTSLRLSFSWHKFATTYHISLQHIKLKQYISFAIFYFYRFSPSFAIFAIVFPFPPLSTPPPLSLSVSNRASARFRRLIEFAWIAQNDIFSVAVASVYRAVVYLTPVASYATEIKIDTILIILCLISYMVPIYPCHRLISLYFGGSSLSN